MRLAVPRELLPIVAAANPCVMTAALPQDNEGRLQRDAELEALELAQAADVVAVGPGLGRSSELTHFLSRLLHNHAKPIVVDADGLNNLAEGSHGLKQHAGPVVITPHPGEFARLAR